MICSQDYLKQLKNNQLKNHIGKLVRIQQQYFGMDTLQQVQKHYQSNKNMLIFVTLCYTVVRYVLFQSGLLEYINMMAPQDQKDYMEDNKSSRSKNSLSTSKRSY